MWRSPALLLCATIFTGTAARALELAPRQANALSTCAQTCHDLILPIFDCESTTKLCFCIDPGITDMVDVCVARNCSYSEQLESKQFQATTCESPRRSLSNTINQLSWTMLGVATLFFLLRLSSRLLSHDGLSASDCLIALTYSSLVGAAICIHVATKNGLGRDIWEFDVDQLNKFFKLFYAFTIIKHAILLLTKILLVLSYLHILPKASLSRAYSSFCWTFIGILFLSFLATQLATILQCCPISSTWNFVYGTGEGSKKCLNVSTLSRAYGALDLVWDVVLLFLPIPLLLVVVQRRLSAAKKAGLSGMYLLGLAVVVCAIGRLVTSPSSSSTNINNSNHSVLLNNTTWTFSQSTIWIILQLNLSMMVVCLPGLSGLLGVFRNKKTLDKSASMLFTDSESMAESLHEKEKGRKNKRREEKEKEKGKEREKERQKEKKRYDRMRCSVLECPSVRGLRDRQQQDQQQQEQREQQEHQKQDREHHPLPHQQNHREKEDSHPQTSSSLHIGLGNGTVTLQHGIPDAATKDKFVYRDGKGRMHEVETWDRPSTSTFVNDDDDDDDGGGDDGDGVVVDEDKS